MFRIALSWLLGLLGAVLGGLLGYFGFRWLANQGLYALVLPGGLVGIGCYLLSRHPSFLRGLLCAAAGLLVALYCDYSITLLPHYKDFADYLAHFQKHGAVVLIMAALGGLVSYWFGRACYLTPRYPSK